MPYRTVLRTSRPALVLAAATAVIGVGLSLGVSGFLVSDQKRTAQDQFDRRADLLTEAVNAETGRYIDTLRTVAAAAGAFDSLTEGKFTSATAPLAAMHLAGATSIVFIVPATTEQIPAAQAYWRARSRGPLTLRPHSPAKDHQFTVFSELLEAKSVLPLGLDLTQAPAPSQALTEASRSGDVTVSDTYRLLRDRDLPENQRQLSFVLTAPVYHTPSAGGARQFRGWVLMGIRGQNFMGATLKRLSQNLLDVTLHAQNANRSEIAVASLRAAATGERTLARNVDVAVAGRTWQLNIEAPGRQLPGVTNWVPLAAAAGGGALSLLLAVLVLLLATGRSLAQAQVQIATRELRTAGNEARRQAGLLEAVMNNISDGVGVVDENGEFLLHNPAAKTMLGLDLDVAGADNWQDHYGMFRADGTTPFPVEDMPLVRALAGESTEQVEIVIRNAARPDGITITVSGRPLNAPGQNGAVAVFHDITTRKHNEQMLVVASQTLQLELKKREATEAELRAFAGVVAHDLKSPLTAVAGYQSSYATTFTSPTTGTSSRRTASSP